MTTLPLGHCARAARAAANVGSLPIGGSRGRHGGVLDVELTLAQPLKEELVQPVGRVQWNPMTGVVDLLVAPGSFHEAS